MQILPFARLSVDSCLNGIRARGNALSMFSMLIMAAIATATCYASDEDLFAEHTAKIKRLLPPNWEVKRIKYNIAPYNLGIASGKQRGTYLLLVGPTVVKGPRGLNDEYESFDVCLMPADCVPDTATPLKQFAPAMHLGSNEKVAVYWNSFTSGTPSWKTPYKESQTVNANEPVSTWE